MGDVHGLPVAQDEAYLTRKELAALMRVHPTTIDKLVRAGMPSEQWGMRVRRFKPSLALAWARERDTERGAA